MGSETKWYHWFISVVVCVCGILAVSVDVDPTIQTFVVALSAFILGLMKSKLPTLPPFVVDIITVGITAIIRYFKNKKDDGSMKWLLLILLIPVLMLSSCTKNFYDEQLREEVITEKVKIIEESMLFARDADGQYVFTINYLSGFYRLALLGDGKISEEAIADAIDVYKKHLVEKRGR